MSAEGDRMAADEASIANFYSQPPTDIELDFKIQELSMPLARFLVGRATELHPDVFHRATQLRLAREAVVLFAQFASADHATLASQIAGLEASFGLPPAEPDQGKAA